MCHFKYSMKKAIFDFLTKNPFKKKKNWRTPNDLKGKFLTCWLRFSPHLPGAAATTAAAAACRFPLLFPRNAESHCAAKLASSFWRILCSVGRLACDLSWQLFFSQRNDGVSFVLKICLCTREHNYFLPFGLKNDQKTLENLWHDAKSPDLSGPCGCTRLN